MEGVAAAADRQQHGCPTHGLQSPTAQNVMDSIYFVSDSEWKSILESSEQFDYIVVGTGPCGLAFVQRILQSNPHSRILVLERGGFFLPEHFQTLPPEFALTIGGLSETFPWTITKDTATGEYIKFQHGMIPFFGGRSILWSGWCPEPSKEELVGWPPEIVSTATKYFPSARELMNVAPISSLQNFIKKKQSDGTISMSPVYSDLHSNLTQSIQDNLDKVPTLTRAIEAPLAVDVSQTTGLNFKKFASNGPFIELIQQQKEKEQDGSGTRLRIVNNCTVEQILNQNGQATALKTSRGILNIGDAKLILAMGSIPPATLIANSFPAVPNVGKHLSAHFISSIAARVSVQDLDYGALNDIELGAVYIAGVVDNDHRKQFHIQLSAFHDTDPKNNARLTFMYAPDVVATPSKKQLETSQGYVVFILSCIGEMDVDNTDNCLVKNHKASDQTTNIILNLTTSKADENLWDVMDESAFSLLEKIITPTTKDSPSGHKPVQYWHETSDEGKWCEEKPPKHQYRVPATVHESSTLIIGREDDKKSSVGLDYRPHGVNNVYVTGACLWPRSGSWNPTLTMVALAQHLADNLSSGQQKQHKYAEHHQTARG